MATLIIGAMGIGLLALSRFILRGSDGPYAAFVLIGAMVGLAGVVCLLAAPLMLF